MKNIYKILISLLLLIIGASSGTTTAQGRYILYPPANLQAQLIEDVGYLTWQKPMDSLGQTPPGIMGYYVYRSGVLLSYINDPDSLSYYDFNLETGTFQYTVTAYYDLTTYGFPGMFGQSAAAGPVTLDIIFDVPFPFQEEWNSGTFSFMGWHLEPSQGNWDIITTNGNPPPVCVFKGIPAQTGYDFLLRTMSFWFPKNLSCTRYFLEFDYQLNDLNSTNSEKLSAEIWKSPGTWTEVFSVKNVGTTGLSHVKVELDVTVEDFRIGFRVTGSNSANIDSWLIDNISIYSVYADPLNVNASDSANFVRLSWEVPCDSNVIGYNIYRTGNSGLPPFNKINPASVTIPEYTDVIPLSAPGIYKYRITALYGDLVFPMGESPGEDTITVDMSLDVNTLLNSAMRISPNPAGNYMNITCHSGIESVELFNLTGSMVLHFNATGKTDVRISTVSVPEGVYLVRITTAEGTVARKISVKH